MHLELLKCLNLYSQQISDRSELLTLVHDLFKRTQIELFSSHFRCLLGSSGTRASPPAARRDSRRPARRPARRIARRASCRAARRVARRAIRRASRRATPAPCGTCAHV